MLKNMLLTTYRSLRREKVYTTVNIVGLVFGIAASVFLFEYIRFETSFDDFHVNGDRVYRISVDAEREGTMERGGPEFTPPIGPAMVAEMPEVEAYTRISTPRTVYVSTGSVVQKTGGVRFADSTFFDLLSYPLLRGDRHSALTPPLSAVLTADVASRLFPNVDPLGNRIRIDNGDEYVVTGIVADPPENSHLSFDVLLSFATLYTMPNVYLDWDGGNQYITYVRLAEHTTAMSVEARFPDFMWRHINEKYSAVSIVLKPLLEPLRDLHLSYDDGSDRVRSNLFTAGLIAVLILFIAAVNFVNLASARALRRLKEVGVRKVFGAGRTQLVLHFIVESLALTVLASLVVLPLVELLRPVVSGLLGSGFAAASVFDPGTVGMICLVNLLLAIAGAAYPAYMLTSADMTRSLRGLLAGSGPRSALRSAFVVLQFAVTIALLSATMVMQRQVAFMKSADPGFDKDHIVVLPLVGVQAQRSSSTLKAELQRLPDVLRCAESSDIPRSGVTSNGYFPEGIHTPLMIHVLDVDADFLATYGIELEKGRGFMNDGDGSDGYLINQTLADRLSWNDPIGKTIRRGPDHAVLGVVRDFHFATLHDRIEPLILTNRPWDARFSYLSVKVQSDHLRETVEAIRGVWEHVLPATPFQYEFLDESFDRLYRSEEQFRTQFLWSSGLAMLIGLLGLMSVVSYSIERRTKEIGIRKVLGSTSTRLAFRMAAGYLTPVLLANIIAWPIAYIAVERWLETFAYHIQPGILDAFVPGAGTLFAALAIVIVKTSRASGANPVESLRYE